ncbi:alpha/beta hydrolase [Geodermatophilus sp. SYSU D01106]
MSDPFHPDLRLARLLPRTVVGPRTLRPVRLVTGLPSRLPRRGVEVVRIDADVSVRLFRPSAAGVSPAVLWMHAGGTVIGSAAQDDWLCRRWARELGAVVASVEYRLAPEHPFPAPLEDCHTALRWLAARGDVDPSRVAIGGASAGGGLAAALALLVRERGGVRPVLQLLSYPMLDDRTTTRSDVEQRHLRLWDSASNRFGWRSYLGGAPASPLAAPARAEDLAGLPPAWIGVGTNDLFHDEDTTYARRLRAADVPTELHVVPGGYHAFDLTEVWAPVSREFLRLRTRALAAALGVG